MLHKLKLLQFITTTSRQPIHIFVPFKPYLYAVPLTFFLHNSQCRPGRLQEAARAPDHPSNDPDRPWNQPTRRPSRARHADPSPLVLRRGRAVVFEQAQSAEDGTADAMECEAAAGAEAARAVYQGAGVVGGADGGIEIEVCRGAGAGGVRRRKAQR